MASTWNDATVIAGVNAVTALLNNGWIAIYSGTSPGLNAAPTGTLLATMRFANPTAFATATASAGTVTATANAITSGTAAATNTAGYCALVTSGWSGTGTPTAAQVVAIGTVGTSGANLNLSSTSIVSGATVSCSSFTITQSETGS
jgi:hypothetical protein